MASFETIGGEMAVTVTPRLKERLAGPGYKVFNTHSATTLRVHEMLDFSIYAGRTLTLD